MARDLSASRRALPALGRRLGFLLTILVVAGGALAASPAPAAAGSPSGATSSAPATVTSAATASTAEDMEALILGRMNDDRDAQGLVRYRSWSALDGLANDRAQRMADLNKLSHDAAGGDIGAAFDALGIKWFGFGEIIGVSGYPWGSESALNIYGLWKGSSPHRAIMFSNSYNYVGIGVVQDAKGNTWVSAVFAESVDHTAPVAKRGSLTRSGTTLYIRWSGYDPRLQTHTAGLRSFDLQLKRDNGTWRVVRDNTTATSARLANRLHGHWYTLRVQAADHRGTLSSWTSEQRIWVP
jgi:uncharacterized protein YkwD